MSNSEKKLIFILILSLVAAGCYLWQQNNLTVIQARAVERNENAIRAAFAGVNIEAEAAYVYDASENKVIYSRHEHRQLPLASLTKIMSAVIAVENMDPDSQIEISKAALKAAGDNGLYLGEKWKLTELVKLMLVASSNDAAEAISESSGGFVSKMNQKARDLGLSRTKFYNSNGLDLSENEPGAVSTAREISELFIYALMNHAEIFQSTARPEIILESENGFIHTAVNTDSLIEYLPNIFASKTGYTDLAGGNLVVAFTHNNKPIIVTVLRSSYEGRFSDVYQLVKAAEAYKDSIGI